jgi:hypothetical protein
VPAVVFQIQLALECLIDRLDGLAQRFEHSGAGSLGLALAGRRQQP